MRKRNAAAVLSVLIPFAAVWGADGQSFSLNEILAPGYEEELAAKGSITRNYYEKPELALLPRYEPLIKLLENEFAARMPNITVESLRLYTKPAGRAWSKTERAALYNEILALSTLSGIQYYSRSRKKMRTLYEKSEYIDLPETKNPLHDPVYETPPLEIKAFVRQKDLTFGDNVYQYTYYADDHSFIIFQKNSAVVTLGPVPIIDKNNMCSCAAIIDTEKYLLIYMVSFVKAGMIPGLKQQISESVNNRLTALLGWFASRADTVFGGQR
ncbi:MAG: hypothetical protein LBG74_04705 [Spirochaetaceae bacterium]|jgi:hypothetical protein|nr:hypothetical protein [Spirochaetaceae bacterium]